MLGPCHWTMNILSAISVAFVYGAAGTLVTQIRILGSYDADFNPKLGVFPGAQYGFDISGYPLVTLGASLMIQNTLSVWTYILVWFFRPNSIKTWSSNAVANAIYIVTWAPSARSQAAQSKTVFPLRLSAMEQVARIRRLVRIVWCGFAAMAFALVMTAYYAGKAESFEGPFASDDVWEDFGGVRTAFGNSDSSTTDWAGQYVSVADLSDCLVWTNADACRNSDSVRHARISGPHHALRRNRGIHAQR